MSYLKQNRKVSRYKVPVIRIRNPIPVEDLQREDDRKFGNRSIKLVLKQLRGEITHQEFECQMQALETEMLPLFQSAGA